MSELSKGALGVHWGARRSRRDIRSAKHAAFLQSYRDLTARVTAFVNLPFEQISLSELQPVLAAIGRMDGATEKSLAQAA